MHTIFTNTAHKNSPLLCLPPRWMYHWALVESTNFRIPWYRPHNLAMMPFFNWISQNIRLYRWKIRLLSIWARSITLQDYLMYRNLNRWSLEIRLPFGAIHFTLEDKQPRYESFYLLRFTCESFQAWNISTLAIHQFKIFWTHPRLLFQPYDPPSL